MSLHRLVAFGIAASVLGSGACAAPEPSEPARAEAAVAAMSEVQLAMTLQAAAEATARKLPLAVDRFTTLTATQYEAGQKTLVFRYDVSAEVDKEELKAHAVRANCASPRFAAAFRRGVRARHLFATPGGMLEIPIAQDDCRTADRLPATKRELPPPARPSAPADRRGLDRV